MITRSGNCCATARSGAAALPAPHGRATPRRQAPRPEWTGPRCGGAGGKGRHRGGSGGGTQGRSEPRADAKALTRLEPGTVVEWRDALPGWIGVRAEGRDLWVREGAIFDLTPGE